jgi:hypothetical protein
MSSGTDPTPGKREPQTGDLKIHGEQQNLGFGCLGTVNLIQDYEEKAYRIPKSDPNKLVAFLLEQRVRRRRISGR